MLKFLIFTPLSKTDMSDYLIVPTDFCKAGNVLEGKGPLAMFERVASACADTSGGLAWRVAGSIDAHGRPRLVLSVKGSIHLICQRCLEGMDHQVDTETAVVVTFSEPEADEVEMTLADDDPTEVIVIDGKVDLIDLIEDEALLSLPLSPRHEVCPDKDAGRWKEEKVSPFAVLKGMKGAAGGKKK